MVEFLEEHPKYIPIGWSSRELPRPSGTRRVFTRQQRFRAGVRQLVQHTRIKGVCVVLMVLAAFAAGWVGGSSLDAGTGTNTRPNPTDGSGMLIGTTSPDADALIRRSSNLFTASANKASTRKEPSVLPHNSRVILHENTSGNTADGSIMYVHMPSAGASSESIATASFTAAWGAIVSTWTLSTTVWADAPIIVPAFSIPFWVVTGALARHTLERMLEEEILEVFEGNATSPSMYCSSRRLRGLETAYKSQAGFTADVLGIRIIASASTSTSAPDGSTATSLSKRSIEIQDGAQRVRVCSGLEDIEADAVAASLLRALRSVA